MNLKSDAKIRQVPPYSKYMGEFWRKLLRRAPPLATNLPQGPRILPQSNENGRVIIFATEYGNNQQEL